MTSSKNRNNYYDYELPLQVATWLVTVVQYRCTNMHLYTICAVFVDFWIGALSEAAWDPQITLYVSRRHTLFCENNQLFPILSESAKRDECFFFSYKFHSVHYHELPLHNHPLLPLILIILPVCRHHFLNQKKIICISTQYNAHAVRRGCLVFFPIQIYFCEARKISPKRIYSFCIYNFFPFFFSRKRNNGPFHCNFYEVGKSYIFSCIMANTRANRNQSGIILQKVHNQRLTKRQTWEEKMYYSFLFFQTEDNISRYNVCWYYGINKKRRKIGKGEILLSRFGKIHLSHSVPSHQETIYSVFNSSRYICTGYYINVVLLPVFRNWNYVIKIFCVSWNFSTEIFSPSWMHG